MYRSPDKRRADDIANVCGGHYDSKWLSFKLTSTLEIAMCPSLLLLWTFKLFRHHLSNCYFKCSLWITTAWIYSSVLCCDILSRERWFTLCPVIGYHTLKSLHGHRCLPLKKLSHLHKFFQTLFSPPGGVWVRSTRSHAGPDGACGETAARTDCEGWQVWRGSPSLGDRACGCADAANVQPDHTGMRACGSLGPARRGVRRSDRASRIA